MRDVAIGLAMHRSAIDFHRSVRARLALPLDRGKSAARRPRREFDRIGNVPQITDVVSLNRLLLGTDLDSDRQLRAAAASLHADMLLLSTLDTIS